ncbi:MAG: Trk system potassium transporter TrkA [Myxococcota bacterium]|nr:Trk system potassium transporter TrkA [Myxococcota bacterium]
MFVLITGDSEVASHIAELLMQEHQVVLIGPDRENSARLERLDIEIVHGQPTSQGVLREAHIDKAGVFVAATDNDEQNIVSCIAARRMGAARTICLLSRPGFVSIQDDEEALAEFLGIDIIVRPAEQLANEIIRIVTVPGALEFAHLIQGRVRVLKHTVEPGAPMADRPLMETTLPENIVLAMGQRGDKIFLPNGRTHFQPGDKVTAIGTPRGIHALRYRFLRSRSHGEDLQKATIIGGGVVGLLVAKGLEAAGWDIKLIEVDKDRCEELAPQLDGLVLHGDGSDMDLLEEERVTEGPALIAVTSNDEKNLLVSLIGRHLGVERVITRADRLSNERMFERVGIDVVRSARGAAIRTVVREVVGAKAHLHAELEHGDMEIIELELPQDNPPVLVKDLRASLFALIVTVVRADQVVIPNGQTMLYGGDRLLIFTSREDEAAAREHFTRSPGRDEADLRTEEAR